MFEVGDMVVCVDGGFPPGRKNPEIYPALNGVYTVRAFDENGGVLLVEVVNQLWLYSCRGRLDVREISFHPRRFRKIRKPDISELRRVIEEVKVSA